MGLLNISHPKDRQVKEVKEEEAKKGSKRGKKKKKSVPRVLTWIVQGG